MKIEVNLDEEKLKELVSEHLVRQILSENRCNPESRDAAYGIREGMDKAIKQYIYAKKDAIIERVVERAVTEIVKKGLPKLLEELSKKQ